MNATNPTSLETQRGTDNYKRRTGRTTRMLEDAIRLAREGRAVYVVVAYEAHVQHVHAALTRMLAEPRNADIQNNHGIKIETPIAIGMDWATLTVRSMHLNCRVLIDPHAIERQFGSILNAWIKYDEPTQAPSATQEPNE
mgnify:CR=1 FL=1